MKNKMMIAGMCTLMLVGCGSKKDEMLFENVPDPMEYFSEDVETNRYEFRNLKGIDIYAEESDDLAGIFSKYTEECETLDVWTETVFIGDASWCCTNEEETERLSINYYIETGTFSICLTDLTDAD